MWELDKQGQASFVISGWRLDVTHQRDCIRFAATYGASGESAGTISMLNDALPAVTEMFIRGDELHQSMPQTETTQSGLGLVLLVIQADKDCLVVESTLSIETLLWDAYPTVELGMAGDGELARHTEGSASVFTRDANLVTSRHWQSLNLPALNLPALDRPALNVLVDQRDHDSLCDPHPSNNALRFFGEFMERGVIRKTQPWWVWTSAAANPKQVAQLVTQLADRPLPLTN